MNLDEITPLILTFNESPNIGETLVRLKWAKQVVLVDSFSTDATVEIARTFANVRVIQRIFDHFAEQCNFGLRHIDTEWTLSLDSDYKITPQVAAELVQKMDDSKSGYRAAFRYCIYGQPLRASMYPPRVILYRTSSATYVRDGHAHRVVVDGEIGNLNAPILHDDRKSLSHWLTSQAKYAELEADKLAETPIAQLGWKDRIRQWYVLAPLLTFFYCLFAKRLFLDGRAGLYYTLQRVYAELLLGIKLFDRRLRPKASSGADQVAIALLTNDEHRLTVEAYELSHPGN